MERCSSSDYYAVDFNLNGDEVYPVAPGRVIYAQDGYHDGYGNTVIVEHSPIYTNYVSLYAHLAYISVDEGDSVTISTPVGVEGQSGGQTVRHLHFAMRYCENEQDRKDIYGTNCQPVVPEPILGQEVYEGLGWWHELNPNTPVIAERRPLGDSLPPTGNWGSEATGDGEEITFGSPIVFDVNYSDDNEVGEIRLTMYYEDWAEPNDLLDFDPNKVWRIIARCDPQEGGCGSDHWRLEWDPYSDDGWPVGGGGLLQVPWLPKAKRPTADEPVDACISFDIFDRAGNPLYAPAGTRCNFASSSRAASGFGQATSLDNQARLIRIMPTSPVDLKQCSDLTISPSNPQVDETVTFSFDVCNDGDQSVTLQNIGPQGHGPPNGQGGLWNVFAHDITVGAGQTVNVSASRSFEWEGTWCIEHVPTQDQDGNWHDLPANGYMQAQCFDVSSSPSPADLRQASDLQVSPAYPMVDQEVTFSYAVKNYGGESITIDTIIPQGYAYDDGQQTGLWNVPSHNITVGPGETVSITARRSFEWEATWCIEHIPVLDQNGVWFDLPANGYMQAQCFDVGPVIPQAECEALIALYNSTDGANWSNNSGWLDTNTPCNWYGVTCSAGHVTRLYLSGNQLSGSIPAELGSLADLQYLSLGWNQLSGSIPPQLGNLANLQQLWLGVNQLDGSIPPELGSLTDLAWLMLFRNRLSGSIPAELGDLVSLETLSLSGNQLSGNIPPQLGSLTSLQHLDLGGNQLSGNIPPQLGDLANLQYLFLNNNQLSGSIPPQLGDLANLQYLSLSSNQLIGSIPLELGNLTDLRVLDLHGNQLIGSIPLELGNLANLQGLNLIDNQLSGSIPPELGNLTNLQYLSLGGNQLSGSIPVELGDLTNLHYLSLYSNQLSGSIPPELGNLTNLHYLGLNSNQFSGALPGTLTNLTNLDTFWFNNTDLCEPADPAFQAWLAGISDLSSTGVTCCVLPGDLDGDSDVDVEDIMLVANCWRMTAEDPNCAPYDLDGDGIITVVDIMKVVAHWGGTCD